MTKSTLFLDIIATRNATCSGYDYEFTVLTTNQIGQTVALLPGKIVYRDLGIGDVLTGIIPYSIPARLAAMVLATVLNEVRAREFNQVQIVNTLGSTISVRQSAINPDATLIEFNGVAEYHTRMGVLTQLKHAVLEYLHRPAGYDEVILRILPPVKQPTVTATQTPTPAPSAPAESNEHKILASVLDILADTSWQAQSNSISEVERCEKGRLRQLTAALELALPILVKNALEERIPRYV